MNAKSLENQENVQSQAAQTKAGAQNKADKHMTNDAQKQ
jgi:hypothetical protein